MNLVPAGAIHVNALELLLEEAFFTTAHPSRACPLFRLTLSGLGRFASGVLLASWRSDY